MITRPTSVPVVGATGSIGRHVVGESIREGYPTRALVRDPDKARHLPAEADIVVGDVTRPETLSAAVAGIDGIVFTLGSDGAGKTGAETVDYGGVRNVLIALRARPARIALMTSIGVTNRTGAYNRATEAHDWKRRSERLVRASGHPYAIVRPGWFDYNQPDELRLVLLQGDTRHAGDPSDGVVARRQSHRSWFEASPLMQQRAKRFELIAEHGPATDDFDALFSPLQADPPGSLDGAYDVKNMPLTDEPQRIQDDLREIQESA